MAKKKKLKQVNYNANSAKQQVKALLQYAEVQKMALNQLHDLAIEEKSLIHPLQIATKNLLENLRSAMDYCAQFLYSKYGATPRKPKVKIYFPYAPTNINKTEFISQKFIERNIPGLESNRPDIASRIESYQHFTSSDNEWLPVFMDLNNSYKHKHLYPQELKKRLQKKLSQGTGGNGIVLRGKGEIILGGESAIIEFQNGAKISGPQTITLRSKGHLQQRKH